MSCAQYLFIFVKNVTIWHALVALKPASLTRAVSLYSFLSNDFTIYCVLFAINLPGLLILLLFIGFQDIFLCFFLLSKKYFNKEALKRRATLEIEKDILIPLQEAFIKHVQNPHPS